MTLSPLKRERAIFFKKSIEKVQAVKSFTQEDCAETLGISVSFVSQIFRLKRAPSYQVLLMLQDKLGITVPEHLGGYDPLPTKQERMERSDDSSSIGIAEAMSQISERKDVHVHIHLDDDVKDFLKDLILRVKD